MSCVRSEKIYGLRPLRSQTSNTDFPNPGDEVRWKNDNGIGLVVSRNGEDCTVLWAKDYDLSTEVADDLNAMYGIDTSQEVKC